MQSTRTIIILISIVISSVYCHFNYRFILHSTFLSQISNMAILDQNSSVAYLSGSIAGKGILYKYSIVNGTAQEVLNLTNSSTIDPLWLRIYRIGDYLITGSTFFYVYNATTLDLVNTISIPDIFRLINLKSQNLIIYTSQNGQIFCMNASDLFSNNITTLSSNHSFLTYIFTSESQKLMASIDSGTNMIRIWNLTSWTINYVLYTDIADNREATWAANDTLLFVSSFYDVITYVYNVSNNFSLITKIKTGQSKIYGAFHYYSGRSVVLLSLASNSVFSINTGNFRVDHGLMTFAVTSSRLVPCEQSASNDYTSFVITSNLSKAYFIKLQQFKPVCNASQYIDSSTMDCLDCTNNCSSCNSTACLSCLSYFVLSNGHCCGLNQYYNITQAQCLNCSNNCLTCKSQTICLSCQTNYTLIGKSCVNQSSTSTESSKILDIFDWNFLAFLNKITGSRRVLRPIFYYFFAFDDFFLYFYHERYYGPTMQQFFQSIKQIQYQKWQLFNASIVLSWFSIDYNNLIIALDFKVNYTSWKFTLIQQNSCGLLQNALNYFIVNIPLVIIEFICGFLFFQLFNKFSFAKLFRNFYYLAFIFILLFDSNIQIFAFFTYFQLTQLFCGQLYQKFMNIFSIYFGLILILVCFGGYYCIYYLYKKSAKHLTDNCKGNIQGYTALILLNGFRNMLLGTIHNIHFFKSYFAKLNTLITLQLIFLLVVLFQIYRKNFRQHSIAWLSVLINMTRICLQITLIFDYSSPGEYQNIQDAQYLLILITMIILVFGTIIEIIKIIKRMLFFCYKRFTKEIFQKKNTEMFIDNLQNITVNNSQFQKLKNRFNKQRYQRQNIKKTKIKDKNPKVLKIFANQKGQQSPLLIIFNKKPVTRKWNIKIQSPY